MIRRVLGFLVVTFAVLVALPVALVPVYAIPAVHPVSTLMLFDWARLKPVAREWVPLADVSPVLVRTVMLSEDGQFCVHRGVDWRELNGVIDDALEGESTRGASTIPMQTAKNLFLWTSRSFVRKGLEVPLALYADLILTKPRLMEIYLNVAEFGTGIYGVQAASWHYFGKPAFALSSREAALLAKTLPAPSKRNPAKPSRLLAQIANRIEVRTKRAGGFSDCVVERPQRQAKADG
jgi:monofunctional glycosyltransferase